MVQQLAYVNFTKTTERQQYYSSAVNVHGSARPTWLVLRAHSRTKPNSAERLFITRRKCVNFE